ncbi:hypothetical protein [Halococcus salsus]|uniref:hypothetical protein n=1 Tax=Halococcus salsus TaxID=2162894 RepID=UPI001F04F3CF|nr:hypothetical protein [Halococcus salsus]
MHVTVVVVLDFVGNSFWYACRVRCGGYQPAYSTYEISPVDYRVIWSVLLCTDFLFIA